MTHLRFWWHARGRWGLVSLVLLGMGVAGAVAQPSSSSEAAPKYWIFFQASPTSHISQSQQTRVTTSQARWRRRTRGRLSAPRRVDQLNANCLNALKRTGIEPVVRSRWLNAVSAHLTDAEQQTANQLRCVRSIQSVARGHTLRSSPESLSLPDWEAIVPSGPSERQLAMINALPPLKRGIDGSGVRVGFLDTEYGDFMHPVFDALRADGRVVATRNFTGQSQSNRHGRSVASVAVGYAPDELIGPAHGAAVLGATTEYVPFERNQEEDFFVAGLEWLEAQGVDVVNVSLGYTTFDAGQSSYSPADLDGDTAITTRAVDIAASLGVVVVVSAGNEACRSPANCWFYVSTPADADSAITVGAVDPDSSRSSFSSFGPTADGRLKPDVAAPGRSVRVARSNGSYRGGSGTSFASPLVAGVAAQMLQVNPELNPIDVRDLLRQTASQAQRPDSILGWGIVNADAAIRAAEALREPPPETPVASAPYPNPATRQATFEVRMPEGGGPIQLTIHNLLGQRVNTRQAQLVSGTNRLTVDVRSLASGLYVFMLTGDDLRHTGKMTIVH